MSGSRRWLGIGVAHEEALELLFAIRDAVTN